MKKLSKKIIALALVLVLSLSFVRPPVKATGLEPALWTAAEIVAVVVAGVAAYGIGWAFRNYLQGTLEDNLKQKFIEFSNDAKPFGEDVTIVDWAGVVQQFNAKFPKSPNSPGGNPLKPNGKVVASAVLMGLMAQYAQWLKEKQGLEGGTEEEPEVLLSETPAVGYVDGELVIGYANVDDGAFTIRNLGTVVEMPSDVGDPVNSPVYGLETGKYVRVYIRNRYAPRYIYLSFYSDKKAENYVASTNSFPAYYRKYYTFCFYGSVDKIVLLASNNPAGPWEFQYSDFLISSGTPIYRQFFNGIPGNDKTETVVASYMWNYETNMPETPQTTTITPQWETPVNEIITALNDLTVQVDGINSTLGDILTQTKQQTISITKPSDDGTINPDNEKEDIPVQTILDAIGAINANPQTPFSTDSGGYENLQQAIESGTTYTDSDGNEQPVQNNKPIVINGNPYDLETLKQATQNDDVIITDGDGNPHVITIPDLIEFITPQEVPQEVPEKQIVRELELPTIGTEVPVTTPVKTTPGEPETQPEPTTAPTPAPTTIPTAAPSDAPTPKPSQEPPDPTATPIPVIDTPTLPDGTELPLSRLGDVISSVFPFSIPWDVKRGIELFSAEPEVPEIVLDPFRDSILPDSGPGADGNSKYALTINFEQYDALTIIPQVTRWVTTIAFLISLAEITRKLIWK